MCLQTWEDRWQDCSPTLGRARARDDARSRLPDPVSQALLCPRAPSQRPAA